MTNKNLVELREKVDGFMTRVRDAYPGDLNCRKGCTDCCVTDISVFPVEADAVRALFLLQQESVREKVRGRALRGENCVFLLDGECAIYPERPIICRSQGLPLLLEEGKRTACHLNFRNRVVEKLAQEDVLNLTTLNTLLSIIHRLHMDEPGAQDARIRLADLAAAPE